MKIALVQTISILIAPADRYATPWNNVPFGMKIEDIYEPNTGELSVAWTQTLRKWQLSSHVKSSSNGRAASSTPASIRKINPTWKRLSPDTARIFKT